MKRALTFATGMAVGYVAGTRAGREKYELIKEKAHEVSEQPTVVDLRQNLKGTVETASKAVTAKVADATSELTKKLHGSAHEEAASTPVKPAPATPGEYPAAPTGIVPGSGTV